MLYKFKECEETRLLAKLFPALEANLGMFIGEVNFVKTGDPAEDLIREFEAKHGVGDVRCTVQSGGIDPVKATIMVPRRLIEEINPYNPCGWNKWPDATPPKDVPMRVELSTGWGAKMYWTGDDWVTYKGNRVGGNIERFRPWEE